MHIKNVHIHIHLGHHGLGEAPTPRSAAPTGKQPPIADLWEGQGGIYAGICRGEDCQPDYPLVLGAMRDTVLSLDAAVEWATTVREDGHADFRLPTKRESALLRATLEDHFLPGFYWTGTLNGCGLAWAHGVDTSLLWSKTSELLACAVRRVSI